MTSERKALFWITGFIVFGVLLHALGSILLPFVAGMAIAYFLDPVADRLEALGLSRRLAVGLIVLFFTLLGLAVAILVLPIVLTQTLDLLRQLPNYLEQARAWLDATAGGRLSTLLGRGLRLGALWATGGHERQGCGNDDAREEA